jgi:protease YdgD
VNKIMTLKQLTFTTAIALLASIPAAIAQSPVQPTLVIANDTAIDDIPSTKTFIPTNLLQDKEVSPTRGIVCLPSQAPQDCDARVPLRSNDYPWSAIGRLQIGTKGHCTATLIDDDWILTNAHCAIDRATHKVTTQPLTFLPNLIDGKLQSDDDRAQVIKVITGNDFSDSNVIPHPQDWAMLKLDRPLGKKYGTIGWKAIPSNLLIKNAKKFSLAGYSFDFPDTKKYTEFTAGPSFTAGIHKGCSITTQRPDKVLTHDCGMRSGASGSAIIGWINDKPYIVAINNAELTNRFTGEGYENYAVNVNQIDDWYAQQKRLNNSLR